jgi:hypothetical protein
MPMDRDLSLNPPLIARVGAVAVLAAHQALI